VCEQRMEEVVSELVCEYRMEEVVCVLVSEYPQISVPECGKSVAVLVTGGDTSHSCAFVSFQVSLRDSERPLELCGDL
jgi:hypothetical protein